LDKKDKISTGLLKVNGRDYTLPFILVTSLFLLWGVAHSILDVLNKHFQNTLELSRAESGLVQFSVYIGYFIVALPAGYFMKRFGYKAGIVAGLLLYALGSYLFIPASNVQLFGWFLVALFVIASGLTFLETAANPYVTVLGPADTAERRINLAQSFNGLGWIIGPLFGGMILFTASGESGRISLPYVIIGSVVLAIAAVFSFTRLPALDGTLDEDATAKSSTKPIKGLWQHPHFIMAVVAQFFYVAAQTGINSFFINYVTELNTTISDRNAALILSFGGMGMFFAGRLSGSFIMKAVRPDRLLSIYSAANVVLMSLVVAGAGWFSISALFLSYFFMSVMFPTIFSLGIKKLGPLTKQASSFIVMSIVGGAVCPVLMGWIADQSSMRTGFLIPLFCFAMVLYYGLKGYRIR
jgi:FHS family L-fucose permease-like MFS transporter